MADRMRCDFEVKLEGAGSEPGTFSGYGSVFNNVDYGGDVVVQGAFKQTLRAWEDKGKLPTMLLQHGGFMGGVDDLLPIGKWVSMEENSKGLKVKGQLFGLNTERGTYLYEGLKAGVLDGLSIGYNVKKFTQGTKPGEPRRKLEEIDLVEVSVVTFPMNDKARVGTVKALEDLQSMSDVEAYLRDACGLSRKQSRVLISRVKSFSPLCDAEDEELSTDLLAHARQLSDIIKW